MTTTFATNNDNDLYIGPDGNLVIVSGIQAVLQACQTAVKAQLGEMVLATNQGAPDFQVVWKGNPNPVQYEAALRSIFLGVAGVLDIIELQITSSNNILSYRAVIFVDLGNNTTGQGEISG